MSLRPPISESELRQLPPRLRLAFAPLDKTAMGFAGALLLGGGLFLVTAYHLLLDGFLMERVDALAGREYSGDHLWLLEQYFRGYDPRTWGGACIGALWGLWVGFVMGWFLAFARNVTLATWLFAVRTRQRIAASRGFLDHI